MLVGGSQRTACKCSFSPPRVKTKPVSIIFTTNKIFLLQAFILQEESHKHICVFLQRSTSISECTYEDGQRLPSRRQPQSCKVTTDPTPEQASKPYPVRYSAGAVTLLRALRQTPAVRRVRTGCIFSSSAPSAVLVLHFVLEEMGGFASSGGFTNTYPRREGGSTQPSAVASDSW